jgi:hypothetical protein
VTELYTALHAKMFPKLRQRSIDSYTSAMLLTLPRWLQKNFEIGDWGLERARLSVAPHTKLMT